MDNKHKNEEEDPYASLIEDEDKMQAPEVETARQRKWRKFTQQGAQLKALAYQGAIMGSLVGGSFGFIIGCYQAVQTRRLIVIPISTLMSGGAFGFFMACGSMIRTQDKNQEFLDSIGYETEEFKQFKQSWQEKYSVQNNNSFLEMKRRQLQNKQIKF